MVDFWPYYDREVRLYSGRSMDLNELMIANLTEHEPMEGKSAQATFFHPHRGEYFLVIVVAEPEQV